MAEKSAAIYENGDKNSKSFEERIKKLSDNVKAFGLVVGGTGMIYAGEFVRNASFGIGETSNNLAGGVGMIGLGTEVAGVAAATAGAGYLAYAAKKKYDGLDKNHKIKKGVSFAFKNLEKAKEKTGTLVKNKIKPFVKKALVQLKDLNKNAEDALEIALMPRKDEKMAESVKNLQKQGYIRLGR